MKIINITLSLALTLQTIDAFAPSKVSFRTSSISASTTGLNDNDDVFEKEIPDPLLSARTARITMPLATILGQQALTLYTSPALAKGSGPSPFDESLKQYFPGSIPSSTVLLRLQSTLRARQYMPYNTILATSIGSEETINTPTSLSNILRKFLETKDGGVYTLGGLGGIPFAGEAGMDDFLMHAPIDGKVIIFFGPNVGISKDGVLGKVERIGRSSFGAEAASGVVVRAYEKIMAGKDASSSGFNLEEDYIISQIKKMPLSEYKSKGGDAYAISKITQNLYDLIAEVIEKEVKGSIAKRSDFWDQVKEVSLVGGIVVNKGHGSGTEGGDDFFQPLMMKTFIKGGEVDLYGQVFGDLSTPRN